MDNIIGTMGYSDGEIPDGYNQILNELFIIAKKTVTPQCGFVIIPQNSSSASNGIVTIDGVEFETDRIVASPLKEMSGSAFFLGTVGPEFDRWSKETFDGGDPLAGYIIDILGSEIAESMAAWLANKISNHATKNGLKCSNRYSPGYCGWSVAEQQKLFKFFPEKFCGVSLMESSLMKPHKSVSGIIGLGSDIEWKEYTCDFCKVEHCYKNRNDSKK
jgi:hypothetical protein